MKFEELVSKYTPKMITEAPVAGVNPGAAAPAAANPAGATTQPQPQAQDYGQKVLQYALQAVGVKPGTQPTDQHLSAAVQYMVTPANQAAITKAVGPVPTAGAAQPQQPAQQGQQAQPAQANPVAGTPAGTKPANANPMKK